MSQIIRRVALRRLLFVMLVGIMPILNGCRAIAGMEEETSAGVVIVEPVDGSQFNKFFPTAEGEFDLIYTQEKEGFSEAKLNQDGVEVATLAVTDTASNPSARDKYANASDELDGYPAVSVGANGTAILVGDRFQVQVRSKADSFTASDREEWLMQFDLAGIEGLQ